MNLSDLIANSFNAEIRVSTRKDGTAISGTNKNGVEKYQYFVVATTENELGMSNSLLLTFWSSKSDIAGKEISIDPNTYDVSTESYTNDEGKEYITHTIRPKL